jgi:hypothetical protein
VGRGHADDRAGTAALDAAPAEQLREEERALEVGVDDVVPFGVGDVDHGFEQRAPGVVHQQIDVAELAGGTLERRLDARLRAQVERDRHDLAVGDGRVRQRVLQHRGVELGEG